MSTGAFMQAMIPLYLMVAIGFMSRKIKVLNSHANHVITQLMLYVTLPALILFSLNIKFSMDLLLSMIWLVIMSIFILSISVFAGKWLRIKSALPQNQKSVYESLIIFGNQGFIGFSISYMIMGEQGIIYLTLFNICYFILIWSYGIYLFTRTEQSIQWKGLIFNPGILSTSIGLFMVFMPFHWPVVVIETFESVGKMTIPLSMILIGSLLADISWIHFKKYSKNIYIWIAASFKLLLLPLSLLIFLFLQVPFPLLMIAILTAGMPNASTITAYAQKFSGDATFASFGVLLTTLLCTLTIPLLYFFIKYLHPYFY